MPSKLHFLTYIVLLLLVFKATKATSLADSCRSNTLEITWRTPSSPPIIMDTSAAVHRRTLDNLIDSDPILCYRQSIADAKEDAWKFLRDNIMEFDKVKMETLGFGTVPEPDGLGQGMIGPTIDLAFQSKIDYPWTDILPQTVFYEYVLNYANVNEARSNWRPLLWDVLTPMIHNKMNATANSLQLNDVVHLVNQKLWNAFAGHESIYFHSGQTPLIFDPMSVLVFGYASCTGLAILLVSALRTAGVPARVVGTPAWNGQPDQGNHNWVEVYAPTPMKSRSLDGDPYRSNSAWSDWVFFEPSANQTQVDDLTTTACSKWFCAPGRFQPSSPNNATHVFAARLVFDEDRLYYPMPWERASQDVPGENRTEHYHRVCSQC